MIISKAIGKHFFTVLQRRLQRRQRVLDADRHRKGQAKRPEMPSVVSWFIQGGDGKMRPLKLADFKG